MSMKQRLLSALMAFLMIFGTFTALSIFPVFAAKTTKDEEKETVDYHNTVFASKEAKLATMDFMLERYGYQLYYEPYTGEVGVKNTATGDILLTNPYDVGGAVASANIKNQLLSQIIIKYSSTTDGTESQPLNSFVEAAQREQITIKNIKNGIRVEYIMGKQESRILLPEQIEKSRFEEQILANITDEQRYKKLMMFYEKKDPFDPNLTDREIKEMQKAFPITKTHAIYVFDEKASNRERNLIESIIKEFCPNYTYEELEYDHDLVEFVSEEKNPVQFRMALEYYLDESGLSVRLPANGIRFDQSLYHLEYIRILPYMGAASSEYTGYTMIPDGSGALVRFEDVLKTSTTSHQFKDTLYGRDFAYHTVAKNDAGNNRQVMRLPIFGLVEDTVYSVPVETPNEPVGTETNGSEAVSSGTSDSEGAHSEGVTDDSEATDSEVESTPPVETPELKTYIKKTGWVAIIEEGDAFASIISEHGANVTHKYNSVYAEFSSPRPKDEYYFPSSIPGVDNTKPLTLTSDRKYTGSFRIRYIMLTDLSYAERNNIPISGGFDASYVGMAMAYRNELIRNGKLEKITSEAKQIPLYLETLGVMDVQDKVLSIPVTVKKPLTTFEDIKTISKELGEAGIHNLVYKLTGYINGGMVNTVPKKIDVEKVAGDEAGLSELLTYAKDEGIEIFLDMDFSYAKKDTLFDGFNKKKEAVRTLNESYTQKLIYSATLQYFTSTGMVAISPSVFSDIFGKAQGDLAKLGVTSLSLGAIGSDLNSDFDKDDPYHREDSKEHVQKTLEKVRKAGYEVMMDGGNAYAITYAKHVLNVALDASNYNRASESIPLYGLIYHGYLSFAGNATNTAGDLRYETLKILENGANPYFVLVYRNSEKLKEDVTLSQYYSISYENWKEDMMATYNKLNTVLAPVMNSPVVNHEFVIGERIPSSDELIADKEQAEKDAAESSRLESESIAESERLENLESHLNSKNEITAEPEETVADTSDVVVEPEDTQTSGDDSESESETGSDTTVTPEVPVVPEVPENGYEYTKYTSDDGMIVKVTFENGYSFILNYNIFAVTVQETGDTVIPALGYLALNDRGEVIVNSGEEVAA